MTHSYPTLRDLATRAVLVNGIPWQEEDKGLPMVKEMEALERLPGDYIITKSSTEVTKAGGGALSPWEAAAAEMMKRASSLKKGGQISIVKEMSGDPIVLWNIVEDTESKRFQYPILAQPVHYNGKNYAWKRTYLISGVKEEEGESYKAKVERKLHATREEKMVQSGSYCWELDRKGKMEVVRKALWRLPTGVELELINNVVAHRD